MALASLDDVKRVLRLTDINESRDAQLRASLDAVESWADTQVWRISLDSSQVETYYDIYEDATLRLPASDVTVTLVEIFEYPSSSGITLSPVSLGLGHGYDITPNGDLILRPVLTVAPFEGAEAQRALRAYSRVEVHYQGTGVVPKAVTEGIAFLAAGHWQDGPRALKGINSERIGDYSYTVGAAGGEAGAAQYVSRARFFLIPYLKHARLMVT